MKCPECNVENAKGVTQCQKCDAHLYEIPSWFPNWKWHLKVLGAIYAVLIISFAVLKFTLPMLKPPYHIRQIPAETTPWLNNAKTTETK